MVQLNACIMGGAAAAWRREAPQVGTRQARVRARSYEMTRFLMTPLMAPQVNELPGAQAAALLAEAGVTAETLPGLRSNLKAFSAESAEETYGTNAGRQLRNRFIAHWPPSACSDAEFSLAHGHTIQTLTQLYTVAAYLLANPDDYHGIITRTAKQVPVVGEQQLMIGLGKTWNTQLGMAGLDATCSGYPAQDYPIIRQPHDLCAHLSTSPTFPCPRTCVQIYPPLLPAPSQNLCV